VTAAIAPLGGRPSSLDALGDLLLGQHVDAGDLSRLAGELDRHALRCAAVFVAIAEGRRALALAWIVRHKHTLPAPSVGVD
jgi:hypothetical protein